jgi:Ca2+-binding RTX toxin-like protein
MVKKCAGSFHLRIWSMLGTSRVAFVFCILTTAACGGGGGGSSTDNTTLGQPNVNSAPVFDMSPSFQVLEGRLNVGTIELSDSDEQDSLALSIVGGADQALFELGVCNASRCTSNELSFAASTDFENPTDVGLNNRYEVELEAFDGTARTKQTVTVDVLNAIEGRTVDAPLANANVCVDINEDSICGPGEEAVVTDSLGYYAAPEGSSPEGFELRVLSVGGTDIVTDKELASLALTADLPTDPSKPIAVTPLSSILSIATNPSDVLVALGFPASVTADDLVSLDPWALAGGESKQGGDFASATESAADIGVDVSVLESVAKDVVVISAQIATLIQAADNSVANSTESGLQNAAERAAMISATVSSELIETIDAAIVNAGGATVAAVDVSDASFVQEVLKETVESSSVKILGVIQAKQEAGELNLSDTSLSAATSILALQESQQAIEQNGLDSSALAEIATISSSVADVIAQIETSVDAGGIAVLTNSTTASSIADLVATVNSAIVDLVTDVILVTDFEESTDVEEIVSASGGLNDAVSQLPEDTGSGTSGGSTDTGSGTSGGSTDTGSGTSGGSTDTGSGTSGGSTDTGSGTSGGSTDTGSGTSGGSTDTGSGTSGGSTDTGSGTSGGSTDTGSGTSPAPNAGPTFKTVGDKSVGQGIVDLSIAEGATSIASLVASDSNGDSLTFTLSGTDASDLTINSSGLLSFASAADYESAQDYDENNEYLARVTVSDGSLTDTVDLRITVTDVNETVSGVLIDGYLAGATVFQDLNNNGALDSGEPNTTSDVLGRFSLALLSASPDAPIRVVNSGFDIGANGVLTAMLDISPLSSGSFVMTPISTLSSRMLSFDGGMKKSVAEKIIADSLSIDLDQAPSQTLFGYDPIALMAGSDATQAAKAKPIYAANSLLMALGNASGALGVELGSSATSYINTQIQTVLNAKGFVGFNPSLSFTDTKSLRSAGYTAFLDGFAEHLSNQKAPVDAFRMRPGTIQLIDFVDGVTENAHWIMPSTTGSTLDASLVNAGLDRSNLNNVVAGIEGAKSPVLRFGLNSIPSSGTSGSMSAAVKIYDGKNTDRIDGERVVSTALNVNWSSLNGAVTFEVPSQSISVSIVDSSGIGIEKDITNSQADLLSVTSGGASTPASLELKIAKLIASLSSAGIDFADYFSAGDYTLAIEFASLDLRDSDNVAIDKVVAGFSVLEDPGVYVYVEDKTSFEGSPELAGKTPVQVNLSRIATAAVEVDYSTASGSASAGTDFTSTSGKLTIGVGDSFGTIAVPVTDDTTNEAAETFSVSLSNALNASIARSTATVTVLDNENVISNATALGDINSKALDAFGPQLLVPIQTLFEDTTATLNGQTKSYKSWLDGYVSDSDIEGWVTTFVASKKSGASVALNSVIENVNTRVAAEQSTDLNTFAIGLTKIVAGVKPLDFGSYLFGSVINDDGTFASGSSLASFNSSLDSTIGSFISLAADTVGDPLGTDTAANFPNATIVILTEGNDTYTGSDDSELIATLENSDTVDGKGGNDKIIGGGAIDTLTGGEGNDHLYGFGANDILNGGDGNDYIVAGLGDDEINGGAGDDTIEAQTGDDTIYTGAGNDTIYGGLGDDVIIVSGTGAKTIDGGTGTNTISFDYTDVQSVGNLFFSEIPTSDTAITLTDASGGQIQFSNILDYTYTSGAAGYWDGSITVNSKAYTFVSDMRYDKTPFSGAYGSVQAFVYENPSNTVEVVVPTSGKWLPQYRMGSYKNYAFDGQEAFTIYGGAGNEVLFGGYQADTITGGAGNDYIFGGDGADTIDAGDGNDVVYTSVAGLTEDSSINGGSGNNTLVFDKPGESGGWDNESYAAITFNLSSGLGNASNFQNIGGGSEADTLTGDANDNVIIGAGGGDTLTGGDGNDSIYGDEHPNDTSGLTYGIRSYNLSDGNDTLYGGAGNDVLYASDGDDVLDGGTGIDTLTGGSGSDTFVLRSGDGADTLTDFADGADSFGLDGSLTFSALTISQSGNDVVIQEGADTLVTVSDALLASITAVDFQSTSTDPLSLSGSSANDTLIGGSGDDTFNAGAGSDTLYGWGGDDTFNITGKSGSYTDVINGGYWHQRVEC